MHHCDYGFNKAFDEAELEHGYAMYSTTSLVDRGNDASGQENLMVKPSEDLKQDDSTPSDICTCRKRSWQYWKRLKVGHILYSTFYDREKIDKNGVSIARGSSQIP